MKKLLCGFILGLVLASSLPAYASGLIGRMVDATYPLFVDGTRCPDDAVSIEGTSYIPVRTAGELFGYDVNFSSGVVLLTKPETEAAPQSETATTPDTSVTLLKTETITLAEYNQLEIGMSYDEAVDIIGGPGIVSDEHTERKVYNWYSTPEGNKGSAWITFKDNRLISKGQEGLE